jgi:hypothetical protein
MRVNHGARSTASVVKSDPLLGCRTESPVEAVELGGHHIRMLNIFHLGRALDGHGGRDARRLRVRSQTHQTRLADGFGLQLDAATRAASESGVVLCASRRPRLDDGHNGVSLGHSIDSHGMICKNGMNP